MQCGSIDLTTHQYAELLRVPLPQVTTPILPHAGPARSPFSQDQYQTSNQQLPQQLPCIDSYPHQPQQLTGQSPMTQQVQPDWSQGTHQHVPSQIPMFSQHEAFGDATPAASANSDVHGSWDGSPPNVSGSGLNTQAMQSPQQDPRGIGSANPNPMLNSAINGLQQLLGESDMPPPAPRPPPAALSGLPPTAPQRANSFNFGQQDFEQPLAEPASSFGQYDVQAGYPQDFMPPHTTFAGQQFSDGSSQSASGNFGEIHRSSHSSHDGSPPWDQGSQWPGQGSTEVPFSTGQLFQGSGEVPQSMLSSIGQLAQGLGPVPQRAAGAFEAGAIPGRPVYGHSQSYSRVPSRRIVRGPSFTQRGELAHDCSARESESGMLAMLVNAASVIPT